MGAYAMQYVIIPHKSDRVCLVHSGMNGRKHPLGKDELMHYRTPGSVNGVRRYQNKDGSLTPLGRQHYGVEHTWAGYLADLRRQSATEDANRVANAGPTPKVAKSGTGSGGGGSAPQTPKVQRNFTFGTSDSKKATPSTPASRQAAAQQPPKTRFTFGNGNNQNAAQPAAPANQNNSAQASAQNNAPAPTILRPVDKLEELRKKTESLYNLNGTKKTDSPSLADKAKEAFGNIKNGVSGAVNDAGNNANAFVQGLSGNQAEVRRQQDMQRTGMPNNAAAAVAGQKVNQALGNAGQAVNDTAQNVVGTINGAGQAVSDFVNNQAVPAVLKTAQDVGGFLGNAWNGATGWLGNAANDVGKAVTGAVNDAGQWIGNAANDVGKAITGAANNAGQAISNLWNNGVVPTA